MGENDCENNNTERETEKEEQKEKHHSIVEAFGLGITREELE